MAIHSNRDLAADESRRGGVESYGTAIDPAWAWAPYEPRSDQPWTLRLAGHLYRRAAFGASWQQLEQAVAEGPQRTVDRLLRPAGAVGPQTATFDADEEAAAQGGGADALRGWWLRRMIETPHPLLEKMTLFWHGHIGISMARVKDAPRMVQHLRLLRAHALGRYRELLQAVASDPAIYLGLNADASRKAMPNENVVRQLMDRLSLGRGHYGDEDVREAARAFTGWFVLRGQLRFFDREHDDGVKNVLGQRGTWNAEDVIRIVLDQPAAPRLLVRRLYRWLVSEVDEPPDALLEPVAGGFDKDYDVARVVETMLRSNLFYSSHAYRRRIKSPVEYALGMIKGLEGMVPTIRLGADLAQLGQDLYHPPTVEGWPGGHHWLNAATVVQRANLAEALLAGQGAYGGKLDPAATVQRYERRTAESSTQWLLDVLVQSDVPAETRAALGETVAGGDRAPGPWLREFVWQVATLPEFQLC